MAKVEINTLTPAGIAEKRFFVSGTITAIDNGIATVSTPAYHKKDEAEPSVKVNVNALGDAKVGDTVTLAGQINMSGELIVDKNLMENADVKKVPLEIPFKKYVNGNKGPRADEYKFVVGTIRKADEANGRYSQVSAVEANAERGTVGGTKVSLYMGDGNVYIFDATQNSKFKFSPRYEDYTNDRGNKSLGIKTMTEILNKKIAALGDDEELVFAVSARATDKAYAKQSSTGKEYNRYFMPIDNPQFKALVNSAYSRKRPVYERSQSAVSEEAVAEASADLEMNMSDDELVNELMMQ